MARPKRDNNLAAQALVDAIFTDDVKACKKHGITRRTLFNYRAALPTDPELSQVFTRYLNEAMRRTWGDELNHSIKEMLVSIRDTIASLESQTTSFEEQVDVLKIKLDFLKAMLEPGMAREVLGVDSKTIEHDAAIPA